ncbi:MULTISPECIES: nuclear transport factor 2 family protein [Rhodococcus]|uniref:Nuclear transport factor 2 family protein n=1 Tax=Rhodococcus chondri TaxID=3065941 RepID=A0ABU7JP10_9NOCA|nr:nuclear transport factor 2 family protein [Rhodococcus sp. CC-R104]MEE2031462.1 nuclear transport factor 2 family protein [Rhodococcus sp. CC-R104]
MTDNGWMKSYYAAWDSADADEICAWFDDDIVVEDVPTGHVAVGAVEARAFVERALELTPGTTYEVVTTIADGDEFAAEWIMRPAGIRGTSIGTLRNGKVATNRDYWSSAREKKEH